MFVGVGRCGVIVMAKPFVTWLVFFATAGDSRDAINFEDLARQTNWYPLGREPPMMVVVRHTRQFVTVRFVSMGLGDVTGDKVER
jgi:hypothetical protein